MMLGELITALEAEDPARVVPHGFHRPHSYRGYYIDLAFEPAENIAIGDTLAAARSALGSTFEGYKGGDYTMDEYADCWLAEYGCVGETIGPLLLRLMLAAGSTSDVETPFPDPERTGVHQAPDGAWSARLWSSWLPLICADRDAALLTLGLGLARRRDLISRLHQQRIAREPHENATVEHILTMAHEDQLTRAVEES